MSQNNVFVVDTDKQPLTPCNPARARLLLNQGKAAVYRRYPFTIILKRSVDRQGEMPKTEDGHLQNVEIKLDPGSKTTGIAVNVVTPDCQHVVWAAELTHRGQRIKDALDSRRAIRRSRRQRKTRYRKPRFLNRAASRRKGRIAPSLMSRVYNIETWVKRLMRVAPVVSIAQELVKFDTQKMQNPEISSTEYQQGTLQGYEVREYLLEKWGRKCAYCGVQDVPLQIEHIQARANGGSDRLSNLTLACEKCNLKKGTLDVKVFLKGKPDLLAKILKQAKAPLKDAAAVNTTRWVLFERLKTLGVLVKTGTGAQTKYNRVMLGIDKTHWKDAACVDETSLDAQKLDFLTDQPLLIKATGHGTRQMCRTDKHGFPCRYVPQFKFVKGFQTGDIVKASVTKGKKVGVYVGRVAVRSTGSFNIQTSEKLIQGISFKYCNTIHKKDGYQYGFNFDGD